MKKWLALFVLSTTLNACGTVPAYLGVTHAINASNAQNVPEYIDPYANYSDPYGGAYNAPYFDAYAQPYGVCTDVYGVPQATCSY